MLQELLHLYLEVGRLDTLDAALELVRRSVGVTWAMEAEDVSPTRAVVERHPGLSARDLVHLAWCTRREVSRVKTFDRALGAAMGETARG